MQKANVSFQATTDSLLFLFIIVQKYYVQCQGKTVLEGRVLKPIILVKISDRYVDAHSANF